MQEQSTQLIQQVFNPELTKQGLEGLRKKYPAKAVYDMTNPEHFKLGKTARAERNKLKKGFERARIDFNKKLVEKEQSLASDVDAIYASIVDPMEREEQRLKDEAARIKKQKEEALAKERKQLNELRDFIPQCQAKDSEYIAGVIESVDLVDTKVFSKDLIHEAIQVKEQTLATLMTMHSDAKAREQLQRDQAEITVKQNLANLQMYATQCIGKSASEIERILNELRETSICESDYGNFVTTAADAKTQSMQQLEMMLEQAKQLEALKPKSEPVPQATGQQEASLVHSYTPLAVWPSDSQRACTPELDHVCLQLEEAEDYIEYLEGKLNAA